MRERYPWYDSIWLTRYTTALDVLRATRPDVLPEFVRAFDVLRTSPDFQTRHLRRVFDDEVMAAIRHEIGTIGGRRLELHEIRAFGRFVVHDLPYFTELQQGLVPLVSDLVGEEVEVGYNFLSLYTRAGSCEVHMDSPQSKWTLDLCIEQSAPWPISFSRVQPWPLDYDAGEHWARTIRADRGPFTSYALQPGEAVVFSGSSQWHYRDPWPSEAGSHFCTLLFFHYIPAGTRELVDPRNWARLFDVSELADSVARK
jgi:hypothetical protein